MQRHELIGHLKEQGCRFDRKGALTAACDYSDPLTAADYWLSSVSRISEETREIARK